MAGHDIEFDTYYAHQQIKYKNMQALGYRSVEIIAQGTVAPGAEMIINCMPDVSYIYGSTAWVDVELTAENLQGTLTLHKNISMK